MKPALIDTHIHLGAHAYAEDLNAVLERAKVAGIINFVCIGAGYGEASIEDAVRIAEKYEEVFAAVGAHPSDAHLVNFKEVEKYASHPKVVAIGETGLDFFHTTEFRQQQEEQFRLHIQLAKSLKKPLVIHSRSAGARCLEILKEEQASDAGGVFHCFAEDAAFANLLAEMNFLVSIPGIVTFKKADNLRTVVKEVPLSQIMLETDGPFLAPQRVRGQRAESAHVVDVAEEIARVKGISFEQVAAETTANAKRFFKI